MEILRSNASYLKSIDFEGSLLPVKYRQTTHIEGNPGVTCDEYNIDGDETRDLGVIKIEGGCSTPVQEVRWVQDRQRAVEKYVKGSGTLKVKNPNGETILYLVSSKSRMPLSVDIFPGDLIQWRADIGSKLEVYEILSPSYNENWFRNQ